MTKAVIVIAVTFVFILTAFYDDFYYSDNSIKSNTVNNPVIQKTFLELPNFQFQTLKGDNVFIESFRGKPILLNFWASWCGPCLQEFPHIMELLKKHDKLIFIAISNDQNLLDIKKFMNEFKLKYGDIMNSSQVIFGWDPQRELSGRKFNVLKLPETFIINADQKIVRKIVGANDWEKKEFENFMETLKGIK